jgi:HSP90 family molecular chaperone
MFSYAKDIKDLHDLCPKQGEVEFKSVLYVPRVAPLSSEEIMNPKTKNIRLYVKRVFISNDFGREEMAPG